MLHGLADWFTCIIALATVAYVVVSVFLWKATKRSADAAKMSADAAKKSSDIAAALHRPYLGVSQLHRHNDLRAAPWSIRWQVENFGTLPASDVVLRLEFLRDGQKHGGEVVRGPCEIFPRDGISGFAELPINEEMRNNVVDGIWSLIGRIEVGYLTPGAARYTHTATFVYDRTTQNFRLESSGTRAGRE